jgi:hypothetical protein
VGGAKTVGFAPSEGTIDCFPDAVLGSFDKFIGIEGMPAHLIPFAIRADAHDSSISGRRCNVVPASHDAYPIETYVGYAQIRVVATTVAATNRFVVHVFSFQASDFLRLLNGSPCPVARSEMCAF